MSDELLLERDKVRRWEQKCATLEGECRQWQERYTGIENDFVKFRKQQFADDNSNPMEQIRADLKIKTFECKEAQKLVQQLRASRDHFKDSVTKLCAQVTGLEEEKRALEKDLYQKCGIERDCNCVYLHFQTKNVFGGRPLLALRTVVSETKNEI